VCRRALSSALFRINSKFSRLLFILAFLVVFFWCVAQPFSTCVVECRTTGHTSHTRPPHIDIADLRGVMSSSNLTRPPPLSFFAFIDTLFYLSSLLSYFLSFFRSFFASFLFYTSIYLSWFLPSSLLLEPDKHIHTCTRTRV
jgi:hypothetical protein